MTPNLKTFFELASFFLVFLFVNLVFLPGNIGFIEVSPNPLWVIVLAFALRYPRAQAMTASAIVTVIYLYLFYRSPLCQDFEALFEISNLGLVLSFNLVTFVISQKVYGINSFVEYLKDSLHGKQEQIRELQHTVEVQEEVARETERKVTGQVHTISNLYTIAESMESPERETVLHGFFEALVAFISVQRASMYRLENGELKLVMHKGFLGESPSEDLDASRGLPRLAMERGEPVWNRPDILKLTDHRESDKILCCGPVLQAGGETVALVCIHEMPFIHFNRDNISFFEILLRWLGKSLEHSLDWESQKKNAIYDGQFEVYRYFYLRRYLNMELANTKRYKGVFSLLKLDLEFREEVNRNTVRICFALLASDLLRTGDILAESEDPSTFFVYLPSTDVKGAEVTLAKVCAMMEFFFKKGESSLLEVRGAFLSSNGQEENVDALLGVFKK